MPRRHALWALLTLLIALETVLVLWPDGDLSIVDLRTFAGVLASTAVGMTALAAAAAALLYALLSTPMMKALHDRGALNRVVFDVLVCAGFWLASLCASLFAAFPLASQPTAVIFCKAASVLTISALLTFIPIGRAFWLLMRHAHAPVAPAIAHDWSKKTQI